MILYSLKKCPSYILKILPQNKDLRFSIRNIDQTEIIPQKINLPRKQRFTITKKIAPKE